MTVNISDLILENHVYHCQLAPSYKTIPGYPAIRVSHTGLVETCLQPTPGRKEWRLGTTWRTLSHNSARGTLVRMVSLRHDGVVRSFPVKRLLAECFIRHVEDNECVACLDGDEGNLSIANIEIIPGKFIRRSKTYRDKRDRHS